MASAFNLTAQLNLRGPSNIRQIASNIKKQLGTITGDVKLKIDPSAINNVSQLNKSLQTLNSNLSQVSSNASAASAAIKNFGQSVSSIGNSSAKLSTNINKTVSGISNLNTVSAKTSKNINIARTEMEEFGRQSALAIRRFAAFSAVTGVFFSLNRAINNGLKNFIEFDRQLVRLQQVTGKNAEGLRALQGEITRLSIGLGVSSDSLVQVSSTLAQAGLSAEETRVALEALAKSELAPSFDDINRTVEGSIALMRQFGVASKDLEKALGSVNSVAAAFAVESGDIIAAIQRTGGVFASASKGVSEGTDALNEFISIFTSIRQTTRESAETIATGLRTIFTRIQRGETIEALKDFGVTLTDAEGKFVGAYKAVELLSRGLGRLDPRDLRFSQIVEELGGFRQIGKVIPLIQQFSVAQQALKVAQAGQDSLANDALKAQLSLANQIAKVREEFLALIRTLGQSDTFQTLAKGALGFASGLIKITGALKGVLPALAILGAGASIRGLTQFTGGFLGGLKKVSNNSGATGVPISTGQNIGGALAVSSSNVTAQNSAQITSSMNNLTTALNNFGNNFNTINTSLNNTLQQNIASLTNNTTSLNNLTNAINNLNIGGSPPTTIRDGGKVLGFNKGGVVPGSGKGDKVPALLEPGEVVMNNRAVSRYGRGNLVRMNKYAKGGPTPLKNLPSQQDISKAYDGNKIVPEDNIVANLNRTRFDFNENSITPINWKKLAQNIQKKYKDNPKKFFFKTQGEAFEESVAEYLKLDPKKALTSSSQNDIYYPIDIIAGNKLGEIKFTEQIFDDTYYLSKLTRHFIKQKELDKKSFTDKVDTDPPVDLGSLEIYEMAEGAKKKFSSWYSTKDRNGKFPYELFSGGLIKKFKDGGVAEIARQKQISLSDAILEQITAFGGIKGIKQIVGAPVGDRSLDSLLRAGNIKSGKNIEEVTRILDKALSKSGIKDAAESKRISQLKKVAVAGLVPIDYDNSFEWNIGNNKSVLAIAKGFPSKYKTIVEQMQQEASNLSSKFAENLQYADIFGGNENLVFDFDDTLVKNADILNEFGKPDILQYSNREAVSQALKKASLTRLGVKLRSLIENNPDFIKNTRVLTARPQNTADLLSSTLDRLGLPYKTSDITGISTGLGSDIPSGKASNVTETEKLIDDSIDNIVATQKLGKKGFLYSEPKAIDSQFNEKFGQGNIEGAILEKALAQLLGYDLDIDKLESNRAVDFPNGLGRAAQFFGLDPNVPTEIKRTLNSDSFIRAREEFSRYYNENPDKFNIGGLVKKFAEGSKGGIKLGKGRGKKGTRGARSPIEPISSETYLKWAKGIYEEYESDPSLVWTKDELGITIPPEIALANRLLTQYSLETGGAGLSLGKRFVVTPDKYIDDSIKPYLVPNPENPNELGFYEDVIGKFSRAKKISTAASKKIGKAEALKAAEARLGSYASAESSISSFKKSGVLDITGPIRDYIISSVRNPSSLPLDNDEIESLKKKLSKTNLDAFEGLVGPEKIPVSVQGQRTKLSEVFGAILETYGSDVSSLEVDNITKAMGQKLSFGGYIQRFMGGGTVRSKEPKLSFGTGAYPFPKRISNSYFKVMQKMLDEMKIERVFERYPKDERIMVDEASVSKNTESFNLEVFKKSFSEKISRDGLFSQMGQFARFIGLPQDDLSSFLPTQIDFVKPMGLMMPSASFSIDPSGPDTRGLEGVDLSRFGFTEADKQDAYGYSKLIQEKNKEVEKVLKTPIRTFDDGSFDYDETKARALWDEISNLKQRYSEKLKLNNDAIKQAKETRKAAAKASGRGSINIIQSPDTFRRKKYDILYHEMTHQLFETLRTKQADTFTKYKERVSSLFSGDNDDLSDAFDSLGGAYSSADVVYGRYYKLDSLSRLLMNTVSKENAGNVSFIASKARSYLKARDFKTINPDVNNLLLNNGYSQSIVDKMEDNGKEEFLTTLVEKLPFLDNNLENILNSTLDSLFSDAGMSRRSFASGGYISRFADGGSVDVDKNIKKISAMRMREIDIGINLRKQFPAMSQEEWQKEWEKIRSAPGGSRQLAEELFGSEEAVNKIITERATARVKNSHKNGGLINRFVDGGTVPALVSNGEAYVPPKLAKKIGYSKLNKMNQADRNGMGRFSSGGISVFKGPGTGTSDSIPTSLPVGSFIIREKATKALGLNRGGSVPRFAVGGTLSGDDKDLVVSRAKAKGISFASEVNMMKKALVDAAKDLMNPAERQNTLRILALENKSRLKSINEREAADKLAIRTDVKNKLIAVNQDPTLSAQDKTKRKSEIIQEGKQQYSDVKDRALSEKSSIQDVLIEQIRNIDPRLAATELQNLSKIIVDGFDKGLDLNSIISSSNQLTQVFNGTMTAADAQKIAAERLSEQFGITEVAMSSLASASDVLSSNLIDKQAAAIQDLSTKIGRASLVVGTFGSMLSSTIQSIGGSTNRSSVMVGAGAGGFASTASTVMAGGSQILQTLASGSQMGGIVGKLAGSVLPSVAKLLGGPLGILGVTAVSTAGAFKDAYNAAREFDLNETQKRVDESLSRVNGLFDEFSKDSTKLDVLDKINKELSYGTQQLIKNLETDLRVPKAFWTNLLDVGFVKLGMVDRTQASSRSMILEREGSLSYLKSVFDTTGVYQEKAMERIAPTIALETSQKVQPQGESILRQFENRIKSGTNINEILSELKIAGNETSEILARMNPEINKQILLIESNQKLTEDERKSKIGQIITNEALKRTMLEYDQVIRKLNFDKLNKEINHFAFSLERMFNNMEQAIGRADFELNKLSRSAELSALALNGNAKAGEIMLDSINIMQNPRAYSQQQQRTAFDQAANMFGSQSGLVRPLLGLGDKLEATIMQTINRSVANNPELGTEGIATQIESALKFQLKNLRLPVSISDKLASSVKDAFKDSRSQEGKEDNKLSFNDIVEDIPAFSKAISSAQKAQELAVKALEFYQNNVNEYAQAMNQMVDYQIEINNRIRKARDIQAKSNVELDRVFGKRINLEQARKDEQASIGSMTGGLLDPQQITRQILELEKVRESQQKESDVLANRGPEAANELVIMQNRLGKTNVALRENIEALKQMADSSESAQLALSKIQEIQETRQAGVNLLEEIATSNPEEIARLNAAMNRLDNNLRGFLNVGSTSEQRSETLQLFNKIAPLLGDGREQDALRANLLESMMRESGSEIAPGLQKIITNLRNPKEDKELQEAVNFYTNSINLQTLANTSLSEISSKIQEDTAAKAVQKLTSAIPNIKLTFEQAILYDINNGIQKLVRLFANPIKPNTKQNGGIIYASSGKAINFQSRGTDTVPAMLTPGEFVINKKATKENLPLIKAINDGSISQGMYFAKGGSVDKNKQQRFVGNNENPLDDQQKAQLSLISRGEKLAMLAGWTPDEKNQDWGHRKKLSEQERKAFQAYQEYARKEFLVKEKEKKEQQKKKDLEAEQAYSQVRTDMFVQAARIESDKRLAEQKQKEDKKTKAEKEKTDARSDALTAKYSRIPPNASMTVAEIVRAYGTDEDRQAMLSERISGGTPLSDAKIDDLISVHLQRRKEISERQAIRKAQQEKKNVDKQTLANRRTGIIGNLQNSIDQLNREEQEASDLQSTGMAGLGNTLNTAITGDQTYNNKIKYIKQKKSILQPQLDKLNSFRATGWFGDDTLLSDKEILEEAERIYSRLVTNFRGVEAANERREIDTQLQTLQTTEQALQYTRNAAEMVAGMGIGSIAGAGRIATTFRGKVALGAASGAGEEAILASTTNAIEVAAGQKTLTEAATDVGVRTLGASAFGGVGGAIGAGVAKAAAVKAGKELEKNIIRQEAAEIAEATRQRIASQEFKPTVRSYEAGFSREGYSPMQLAMMDNAPSPMKNEGFLYQDLASGDARVAPFSVRTPESKTDASIAKFLMAENAAENISPSTSIVTSVTPIGVTAQSMQAPVSKVAADATKRKPLLDLVGGEEAFNTARTAAEQKAEEAAIAAQRSTRYDINPLEGYATREQLTDEATRRKMSGITVRQKAVMETLQQKPSATVDDIRAQLSSQARSSSSSAKEKAVLESMSTNKPSTAQNVSASVQSSAIDDLTGPLPSVSGPTMDEASRLQEIDAEILSLRSKERKGWFGSGLGRINNEESIATLTSEARKIRGAIDTRDLMARGSRNLEIERAGPGASFYEGDEWKRFVEGGIPNEFRTYGTAKPNYTEEGMAFARLRDAQMNSRGMKGGGNSGNYSGFENAMFDPKTGSRVIDREFDQKMNDLRSSIGRSGGTGYTTDPTGGIRIIGNDTTGRPGAELYNIPADSVTPELLENINRLNIQKFNRGGLVYASNGMLIPYSPRGTDTVPAMLTPGEFVINRESTQKYKPVLEAINNGSYSRGGIVSYLNQGGYLSSYRQNGGNINNNSFDFTRYMSGLVNTLTSSITEAFDKALSNIKQPNNSPNGVSNNNADLASIDNFVNRLNNIANILSNIYIPPQITITGKHDVVVTINGDTVLNQLRPDIAGIVVSAIKGAFADLKAKNPENNTINFDIDINSNRSI